MPCALALIMAAFVVGATAAASPQKPLTIAEDDWRVTNDTNAPFIFNTLSGLLQQWPNTLHHNGHTIIPGTLAPFTLLHHARKDTQRPPPSPEWFAFEPEMSYAIMVSRGSATYMHTFRTTRPVRIVYFDGMSSALGGDGWLDSQEVLIARKGRAGSEKEVVWWDDYGRLERLCQWGSARGIEGFVRMNTGFELMWCDFHSPSIEPVSFLNITPPGTQAPHGDSTPPDLPAPPTDPKGPPRPPPRWRRALSPLALTGHTEWSRAVAHRSFVAQPRITLDYAGMVSFYHPRLSSLADAREGQRMRDHRVWLNISDADAERVADVVDEVVLRGVGAGSGLDWGALGQSVVEYWAGRVMQTRDLLANTTNARLVGEPGEGQVNLTRILEDLRRLTYSPLNPYMDTGAAPHASGWELFFGHPSLSLRSSFNAAFIAMDNVTAFDRCAYALTSFLSSPSHRATMTPQERLLHASMDTVTRRLCHDFGTIFAESMDLPLDSPAGTVKFKMSAWAERIARLARWLDWPAWLRCEEVCAWDHVCVVPMWPMNAPHNDEDPKPYCMNLMQLA